MHRVEAKLARWKQLYIELNDARSTLRDRQEDPAASAQLKAEVRRLQRESERALDEIHAAVAQSSLTNPRPR
jgi:hypothetical protein